MVKLLFLILLPLLLVGCLPYVYHEQDRVRIEGLDLDATLKIARIELEEGGFDATLTIWAIRDQVITVEGAKAISELYFRNIDKVAGEKDKTTADFGVWHFEWAISNFYRNGDNEVRAKLEDAYFDARRRPESLETFKEVATEHVNGDKIYMGDIHVVARSYALSHIIAPGNKKYLQSLDDYLKKRQLEAAKK